jgi:hypothetical protein
MSSKAVKVHKAKMAALQKLEDRKRGARGTVLHSRSTVTTRRAPDVSGAKTVTTIWRAPDVSKLAVKTVKAKAR